jgi:uncharacterized membrane protein
MNTRRCSVCTSTSGHQSTNTFSKSVCLFLSRPILSSVCSVCLGAITPLVSHRLRLHETVLVCTSTHGHQSTNTFSQSVCLFLSRLFLSLVRFVTRVTVYPHHLEAHETMLGVCEYAWSTTHRDMLSWSVCSYVGHSLTRSVLVTRSTTPLVSHHR